MKFTVYCVETGEIASVIDCPLGMENLQIGMGQGIIEGAFSDEIYYVENGEAITIPASPSPHHQFNYSTKQWEDPRTLADLQAARWTAIKAAREGEEFGTFTWDGSTFDSDLTSQSRIQGAAQLAQIALAAGQPFSIEWTLANNTARTLDASQMIAVGMAMGAHINACHQKARALRQQIDAATSAAEIEAIAW